MNHEQYEKAAQGLRAAEAARLDVRAAWRDLENRRSAAEVGNPTADDRNWPLVPALPISEHVEGGVEERPVLSCALVKGRAYALTPAQRDVVRDRYAFTPAPLVEVVEAVVFPQEPTLIHRVTLKSIEHVDPRRRAWLQQVTITGWGEFMSACRKREVERLQQAELGKRTAQVQRLLDRAKARGMEHGLRGPGTVANILHAQCEQKGLTTVLKDPDAEKARHKAIREELRVVLLSKGETALAELVNEPIPPREEDDDGKEVGSYGVFTASLDGLIDSLLKGKS